jgi:hypothetical protein
MRVAPSNPSSYTVEEKEEAAGAQAGRRGRMMRKEEAKETGAEAFLSPSFPFHQSHVALFVPSATESMRRCGSYK